MHKYSQKYQYKLRYNYNTEKSYQDEVKSIIILCKKTNLSMHTHILCAHTYINRKIFNDGALEK